MANPELRELRERKRWLLRAMKDQGVRKMSFMNGGHTDASYRMNADLFDLNCRIKKVQASDGR